jgi:type I restriction enzyme S subunit
MRTAILKDITTKIGSGATPTGGERSYKSDGIALIRSQNVLDFSFSKNGLAYIDDTQAAALNNVTVEPNDILLNITGDSIARCCLVPDDILPARVNQHVSIVRCDTTVNSKYVFYYLQFLKPYLLKICGVGGTRNALTKEVIEALNINLSDSQDKIAEILYALDQKITLNSRINTELEQMARTIYNYWFVQFDFPISAAQAAAMGRPGLEGKPYKASGGEMVWNEELKREVPRGWGVGKLNNLVSNIKDVTISGDFPDLPYVPIDNLPIRKLISLESSPKDEANSSLVRFKKDDILVGAMRVYFHRVCLASTDGITRTTTFVLRPKNIDSGLFSLFTIDREDAIKFATANSKGSTIPYASWEEGFENYSTVIPNETISKQFNGLVSPILENCFNNEKQNRELTRLRDFLLPLLMNGQARISEK